MNAKIDIDAKLDKAALKQIDELSKKALEIAGDAILSDLKNSGTLPYDTGNLQNNTFVNKEHLQNGNVEIVSSTPYAERLYYGNDFNFKRDKNSNANSNWFSPYIDGVKQKMAQEAYEKALKNELK